VEYDAFTFVKQLVNAYEKLHRGQSRDCIFIAKTVSSNTVLQCNKVLVAVLKDMIWNDCFCVNKICVYLYDH